VIVDCAYYESGVRRQRKLSLEEAAACPRQGGNYVWIELDDALTAEQATELLSRAPSVRVVDVPTPGDATKTDQVLVGRIRADRAGENGLVLFLACDNLVKGAALNAIQIAELILDRVPA